MSMIQVEHLTFCYDGGIEPVFEDVSFVIDTDWKLGLTGRNGRGKTTLLKLLAGEYEYSGSIRASVEMDCFPFPVGNMSANVIDVIEEADPSYELWKVCRELTCLDMAPEILYRPFTTLSGGEQTRVMLAALFARENAFLLIDEPTNHLDMEARERLMGYLQGKKGFILVSHDRYFLDGCVDHILAINRRNMEVVRGNFTTWQEEKAKKDAFELGENERLKKDIRRLEAAAARTESWSETVEKTKKGVRIGGLRPDRGAIGHKAAKLMKRSKNMESRMRTAAEEKRKLLKNVETAEELKICPLVHHKKRLVQLEDVTLSYGVRAVLEGWSMHIDRGERVLLAGGNGSGKSTVIRAILSAASGEDACLAGGRIDLAPGLVLSYVPQDPGGLSGNLRDFARERGLDLTLFMALLRKMDFSRLQFEKPMEDYSLGQKKKVLLAASLSRQAHLYIWDEPMNYIDIFSRDQIAGLIQKYSPTMLLVEHDRAFAEEVSTRRIRLSSRSSD
ncbi:ribosomal protection-like ABC-F family protein [Faecalicatena fissicatena]|uniref:ABC-F type ribosomal protection protein n=1 Tax=Faecalicatena fissicatena TaxID=290055 RepID=A0ABS2EBU5_9FIRM|nr:ABC-F type ribosomal protection protein [Faecalicatena fissicatena]MBM6739128.1 ABC-F type ribosomal protection protein [Faecalicatena fissicatena]